MATAEFTLQTIALLLSHHAREEVEVSFAYAYESNFSLLTLEEQDQDNANVFDYVLRLGQHDSEGYRHLCDHCVQMLLEAGISAYTKRGPLTVILSHIPSTDTCVRLCTLLLEAHPGLIEWDKSALLMAVSRIAPDSLLLTELLLVRGADPNKYVRRPNRKTVSTLYAATRQPLETSRALLELLMQYGADPFYFEDDDEAPFIETVSPVQAALILDVFEQRNNKTKKRKMRVSSSGSASFVPEEGQNGV